MASAGSLGTAVASCVPARRRVRSAGGPAAKPKTQAEARRCPRSGSTPRIANALVLTAPGYRLTLSKENGEVIDLLDRRNGVHVLRGQNGCLWAAKQTTGVVAERLLVRSHRATSRFSYRWSQATYDTDADLRRSRRRRPASTPTVTIVAARGLLRPPALAREQRRVPALRGALPGRPAREREARRRGLHADVSAGHPIRPSFFSGHTATSRPIRRAGRSPTFSPPTSGPSHLAMYSVNPAPSPIAPVDLGFVRNGCACAVLGHVVLRHARVPDLGPARRGLDEPDRADPRRRLDRAVAPRLPGATTGSTTYPSLADEARPAPRSPREGAADQGRSLEGPARFRRVGAGSPQGCRRPRSCTRSRSSPAASTRRIRTSSPPILSGASKRRSQWDGRRCARPLGQLVMPYLNVSWWDTQAPSVGGSLTPPLGPKDIAVHARNGTPATEQFGDKDGYIVSPHVPAVRSRVDRVSTSGGRKCRSTASSSTSSARGPGAATSTQPRRRRSRTTTAGCRCSRRTAIAA